MYLESQIPFFQKHAHLRMKTICAVCDPEMAQQVLLDSAMMWRGKTDIGGQHRNVSRLVLSSG